MSTNSKVSLFSDHSRVDCSCSSAKPQVERLFSSPSFRYSLSLLAWPGESMARLCSEMESSQSSRSILLMRSRISCDDGIFFIMLMTSASSSSKSSFSTMFLRARDDEDEDEAAVADDFEKE